jgi:hypothetical protein
VSTYSSTSETWSFNTNSSLDSQAGASGSSFVDLSSSSQPTTFTSSANSQSTGTSGGSASGSVTWSRNDGESSSDSGSGQFSTSFSNSATVTGQVSAHGTKQGTRETIFVTASGDASFNGNFSSLASVDGQSSSPTLDVNFASRSSTSVTSSGSSNFVGTETPDGINTAGSSTVSTTGTVLSASQSAGTATRTEGGQQIVTPFRNNSVSTVVLWGRFDQREFWRRIRRQDRGWQRRRWRFKLQQQQFQPVDLSVG